LSGRPATSRPALALLTAVALACALPSCAGHRHASCGFIEPDGPWEHAVVSLPDRVDGAPLRMHYLAAGPVDAPRVVLVHGFPDLSYGWRHVIPALARDHRVLAPDTRGYGGTDRPDDGYDMHTLAADLAAFIAASAVADGLPADTPAHLVAHDWGAAAGWWVAIDHPGALLSYTGISVPHPLTWFRFMEEDAEQRRRAGYQKTLALPGIAGVIAGFSKRRFATLYRGDLVDPAVVTDEDLSVYAATFRSASDWRPPLRYYQRLRSDRASLILDAEAATPVSVPVLVLWGEQDSFLMARQAARSCRHVSPGPCEVTLFGDAGHWVQWDDPDGLVERWRDFVGGLQARPTE
jgi:epoxide hydrolase 4